MDIERIFEERKNNPLYNTSYPLKPEDWSEYKIKGNLPFLPDQELSFYIHIPFCKHLCSFCEYVRLKTPSENIQLSYINKIHSKIETFLENHPKIKLNGFDIGGGTPTSLNEDSFRNLLNIYEIVTTTAKLSQDFEPSIEGTFSTITAEKIAMLNEMGIRRVSLGVQSSDTHVNKSNHRKFSTFDEMSKILSLAREGGIHKINLDFMYGLKNQNLLTLREDLKIIKELNPEQVTLYELRTNRIAENSHTTSDERYDMYTLLYEGLISMGYFSSFGQNTFSKFKNDLGVSSYLRHRMREGCSYKGFGLGAQSMSKIGLSYNIGKDGKQLNKILESVAYSEEYTYVLPPKERASKYIAIAAYSGVFSLKVLSNILEDDASKLFSNQLEFCIEKGLISLENDIVSITKDGFKYYGPVFSLFYDSKNEI